ALQEAALGADEEEFADWLHRSSFVDSPRLAERIKIERGWELAVETALRIPLDALCQKAQPNPVDIGQLNVPKNRLCLVTRGGDYATANSALKLVPLMDKVVSDWDISSALAGVYIANDEAEAWQAVAALQAHESVITKSGLWLGPNWLQVPGAAAEQDSVLQRERALEDVARQIAELKAKLQREQESVGEATQAISAGELRLREIEQQLSALNDEVTASKTELARNETMRDQIVEREQNIALELNDLVK
ncbi:MAG: hypothetical protein ACU84Q_09850, partial [Gammaproteobacteria bacterium]